MEITTKPTVNINLAIDGESLAYIFKRDMMWGYTILIDKSYELIE